MTHPHAAQLATPGVWCFTDGMTPSEASEFALRVEALGYSALWLPETTGRDPFAHIAYLATAATGLMFATGIASIFNRHPGAMKQAAMTLTEQTNGRFILGLGVSHARMVAGIRGLDYSKPMTKMRQYIDHFDTSPYMDRSPLKDQVPSPPRVLAALGPRMLALSGELADGAHTYWTTPEHTADARAILGPDRLLCVEQKVVLSMDSAYARSVARAAVDSYAHLPNYRKSWERMGFTNAEIDQRGNRFLDALVPWGDEDTVREGVQAHYRAGATHVCLQPLSDARTVDVAALERLAPAA